MGSVREGRRWLSCTHLGVEVRICNETSSAVFLRSAQVEIFLSLYNFLDAFTNLHTHTYRVHIVRRHNERCQAAF